MEALFQRLNHYGFEKAAYDECKGLIAKSNQNHAKIINLWFAVVNVLSFMSATFGVFGVDSSRSVFFVAFAALSFGLMALIVFGTGKSPAFGRVITVLNLVMYETYSVLMSNAEPYTTCWMFLVLMVIVALSFIETMGAMSVVLLVMSVIFCYTSFLNKPLSIATMDFANTIEVVSLALVLHFAFQRARVNEFVTSIRDEKMQRMLKVSSDFDSLTSLLNRGKFFAMAEEVLRSKREGCQVALVIIDLDEFKQINDGYGHQMGDTAIQLAARVIVDCLSIDLSDQWDYPERVLREGGSFAGRLGGDEFIILLQGYSGEKEMMEAVSEILDALHGVNEGDIHGLKASMGITLLLDDDETTDGAYKRADTALYVSKGNGKDQITAIWL